ncbi:MAG: hypothetical protein U0W40_02005 [Acidimicrobiia bacterium]
MRARIRRSLLGAAATAALLAGGLVPALGAAPAGASAMNGACQAVTRDQVTAALNKRVGAPRSSTVGGVDVCTWKTKAGVTVTYTERAQTDAARADFDKLAADDKNIVIAGVGDKSIAQCTKGGPTSMECQRFGKLYVLHGDQYSVVTVTGLPKGFSVENELTGILQIGRNSQGQA